MSGSGTPRYSKNEPQISKQMKRCGGSGTSSISTLSRPSYSSEMCTNLNESFVKGEHLDEKRPSIPNLVEQIQSQKDQIETLHAESMAKDCEHNSAVQTLRQSYNEELVRLQTLISKYMAPFSHLNVKGIQENKHTELNVKQNAGDAEGELSTPNLLDLQKEVNWQNKLLKEYQRENEMLCKDNKALKQKLTSSVIPSEDANITAERLVRENAVLHIGLEQLREENKSIRALRDAADYANSSKKYEDKMHCLKTELSETQEILKKQRKMYAELCDKFENVKTQFLEGHTECVNLQTDLKNCKIDEEIRLKKINEEHEALVNELNGKLRCCVQNQQIVNQHAAIIKKQKLEISKLKSEIPKPTKRRLLANQFTTEATTEILDKKIEALAVEVEHQKSAEHIGLQSLMQEFEAVKLKYEEHIRELEAQLESKTGVPKDVEEEEMWSKETPRCSKKRFKVPETVTVLRREIILLKSELNQRKQRIDNLERMQLKMINRQPLRQATSQSNNFIKLKPSNSVVTNDKPINSLAKTVVTLDFYSSAMKENKCSVAVQTMLTNDANELENIRLLSAKMERRIESLVEDSVSAASLLRARQNSVDRLKAQEKINVLLIQHLKTNLTKEKMLSLKRSQSTDHSGTAMSNICCELNLTRQRADKLQMQMDTLRRLHIAAVTGQPPREAMQQMFDHLAQIEQQQEIKNGYLEEYIQCRLLEEHTMNKCICADEASIAASATAHWREIAERRAGDVSRLGQEIDKLIILLTSLTQMDPRVSLRDTPTSALVWGRTD